ncbi:MAG: isoprenyl transferase [Persicimonas sp.]
MATRAETKKRKKGESNDLTVDEDLLDDYEGAVPDHVAFIMDGNGRWAKGRDLPRLAGHRQGAESVRCVVESCRYLEVDVATLYAFSTQNWERPDSEVSGLMTLFDVYIQKERERLIRNGIRLRVIGDRSRLVGSLREAIAELEEATATNDEMLLQVAVSYGGREEILRVTRTIARQVEAGELAPGAIDETTFEEHLYTRGTPDPDLVVRTSGEYRISNFLLWQIAYSELYVTDTLWPDFDEAQLLAAFESYSSRERRFGKTGDQIGDDSTDDST